MFLSIRRKLTTVNNLGWKFKCFIVLLVCNFIVIYLYGISGNKAPFPSFSRTPDVVDVSINLRGGSGRLSQKEIIILQWSTYWGTIDSTHVLDSDKCSILKTGTTQQPLISRIFDTPCRITYEHRYLSESHAVVFHSPDLKYNRYTHIHFQFNFLHIS